MTLINRFSAGCRRHPHWMALTFFSVFVGAMNWPLVLHFSTHVVGRPFDDVFGILWDMDWAQRAVFDWQVSPFFMPDVFYPHGFFVGSSSPPMWLFTVLAPATRVLGPVIVYNLVSLIAYALAGFGMYQLVVALSRRRLAGIVAGCVYITAPILTLRLGGHTDILFSSMWLPYLAWFSHRTLQDQQRRTWLLAGLFLGLACLGHWQFVFFAPLLPLIIIGVGPAVIKWRRRLALIAAVGLTGAVVAAPFAILSIYARSQMYTTSPTFPLTVADNASLSPDRLLAPNPLNSLWGKWSQTVFPLSGEAAAVSVGYTALIAAAIGLFRRWPQRRVYIVLLAVVMVLALGLTLHWDTQRVVWSLPTSIASALRPMVESIVGPNLMPPGNAIVIPLPMSFLYRLFPFLAITRVWARYMIVGMLAVGVLAGSGIDWLMRRFPRRVTAIFAITSSLIFVEGLTAPYAAFTAVSANARPIDVWLSQQPSLTLIEYPWPATNKLAMYRQSLHHQRLVNGYASIEPSYLTEADPVLGTWPNAAALDLLRQWKVDYVVVNGTNDPKFMEETLPDIQAVKGLCLERDDNEPDLNRHTYLFRIMPKGQVCGMGH